MLNLQNVSLGPVFIILVVAVLVAIVDVIEELFVLKPCKPRHFMTWDLHFIESLNTDLVTSLTGLIFLLATSL